MKTRKYKLELTKEKKDEFMSSLISIYSYIEFSDEEFKDDKEKALKGVEDLIDFFINLEEYRPSVRKSLATRKATETREKKVKEKINRAIDNLRIFSDKAITHYAIAKEAKVSFVTVKKYISENDLISLNKIQ
ncbi:MAG: hypothetical protein AB7D96_07600 [Arcobacteraceae bacterium]|jgi:Asp-tRNA(Asn)/Glu-tRNA(Gln) amidotransferase C subunit